MAVEISCDNSIQKATSHQSPRADYSVIYIHIEINTLSYTSLYSIREKKGLNVLDPTSGHVASLLFLFLLLEIKM